MLNPHLRPYTIFQDIMTEPEEFITLKGITIPRRISVDEISFSAHVDYAQNSEYIEQVKAQHVVESSLFRFYKKQINNSLHVIGPGTW